MDELKSTSNSNEVSELQGKILRLKEENEKLRLKIEGKKFFDFFYMFGKINSNYDTYLVEKAEKQILELVENNILEIIIFTLKDFYSFYNKAEGETKKLKERILPDKELEILPDKELELNKIIESSIYMKEIIKNFLILAFKRKEQLRQIEKNKNNLANIPTNNVSKEVDEIITPEKK